MIIELNNKLDEKSSRAKFQEMLEAANELLGIIASMKELNHIQSISKRQSLHALSAKPNKIDAGVREAIIIQSCELRLETLTSVDSAPDELSISHLSWKFVASLIQLCCPSGGAQSALKVWRHLDLEWNTANGTSLPSHIRLYLPINAGVTAPFIASVFV